MGKMTLDLKLAGHREHVTVEAPAGDVTLAALAPLALAITDRMVANVSRAESAAGRPVRCEMLCSACCRQLVVMAIPELLHLNDAIEVLPDPGGTRARARFATIDAQLAERDWIEELFDPTFSETPPHIPIAIDYTRAQLACPLLADDLCSAYTSRPLACRTHGVTTDPALCVTPFSPSVGKLSMPTALSPVLANLAAELLQRPACLIPLPLIPRWLADNPEAATRRWPAMELFDRFIESL